MQTSIRGLSPQADGFRRHSNTRASVVGSLTNLTQRSYRVSPMRTASGYHAPAVPYHTLICGSLSTPNTALVRKNAEYITNTEDAGARIAPTPPWKRGTLHPNFEKVLRWEMGGSAAALPEGCFTDFPQAPQVLQRTRIADAMALRAPRCRLCAFAGACAAPAPRESAGRFTPVLKGKASQDFPRVARSYTLLRTGTSPCSVSVR